jgi:hypothetical protein
MDIHLDYYELTAYLLSQEVTDFEFVAVLLNDAVYGKVSVNSAHLV